MTRARVATFALAALSSGLASCVNLHFDRAVESEPIAEEAAARIRPGTANLPACLAVFGAPVLAFEQPERRFALAWAWRDEFDWGISVSLAIRTGASLSYRWSDAQLDFPAVLVLFDEDEVVEQVRRGTLRDVTKDLGKRKRSATDE